MKLKRIIPYFLVFILSGCGIAGNLDQISTLQGYSKEKDAQHKDVKTINDHYDALLKVIGEGHITDYKDQSAFEHSFGKPIVRKNLGDGGERWLYRYAIFRLAKDKVYVYFDRDNHLVKWEKLPCSLR